MKKAFSLVLALVLVLGMSVGALAAPPQPTNVNLTGSLELDDVIKSSNKFFDLVLVDGASNDISESAEDYRIASDITVNPVLEDEDTYAFNLDGALLSKDSDFDSSKAFLAVAFANGLKPSGATKYPNLLAFSDVNKFDLEVKLTSSSPIFKGVSLKAGSVQGADAAIVRFELLDYLDSASTKSFTDKLALYADGKKLAGTEFDVKGKYKNAASDVEEADENEWDLSNGQPRKLNVDENVRNATIELDYDVFLKTTLYNGRDVYARVSNIADNTQWAVTDKYSTINEVLTLKTVGFTSNTTVTIDRPEKLFVYGVDAAASYDAAADSVKLVFVGTTKEELPVLDQYFLSTKELVIEAPAPDAVEPPVDIEPVLPVESDAVSAPAASNPNGGGDDYIPNANYNPGTGR